MASMRAHPTIRWPVRVSAATLCVWFAAVSPLVADGRQQAAPAIGQQAKPPAQTAPPAAKPAGTQTVPPAGQATPPAGQSAGQAKPPAAPPSTPPATQAKPPAAAPAKPPSQAAPSARLAATVFVTDPSGKPWPDVKVLAIGPISREAATDRDGVARLTALRAGSYRLRFESTAVVTFEREMVLKAGPTSELEVTLNAAPPPPPPPPAPEPQTPAARPSTFVLKYAPTAASLPDWLGRNLIGRSDPVSEEVMGESNGATATVLQIRDPLRDRAKADVDQLFYVIAGDGSAVIGDRKETITAGWFLVVPRGTPCAFERRGRNPLILLVVVAPPQ